MALLLSTMSRPLNIYINICMYIHTYGYIYVYICVFIHRHTHTHIYIYICVCVCVCVFMYTYMHMHASIIFTGDIHSQYTTYVFELINAYMSLFLSLSLYICIYIYNVYVHKYLWMYNLNRWHSRSIHGLAALVRVRRLPTRVKLSFLGEF